MTSVEISDRLKAGSILNLSVSVIHLRAAKMTEGNEQVDEILTFAISREIEAYEFYMALAGRMSNPATGKLFEDLARDELEHRAKLELEVMKIGRVVTASPPRPDAQKLANIRIADYMVDPGGLLDLDYEDALFLGMKKEKTSFRLYVDLAALMDDEDSHEVLLTLAEEEARHKMQLEAEYDKLKLKGDKQ